MRSALQVLSDHVELGNPTTVAFVVACFHDYVAGFLRSHPDALEPDFAQITVRVRLTVEHRAVRWVWTQLTPEARQVWSQDEHAAAFVLRVLARLDAQGLRVVPEDWGLEEEAVYDIYCRLCRLQSLWLGSGTWIEDARVQAELRSALVRVMEEIELVKKPPG